MQEEYIEEFEDIVINEISIRDSINCLDPEIIERIQIMYGNIDTYIESLKNKEYEERFLEQFVKLNWRDQKVLMLRFGLFGGKAKTLEEVARIMGITRERVRQIESKCLRRGCTLKRSKKLRDYLD